MENTKKLTGKDLINVGIYTAMTLVIFFVVGLLTALPVVYPFLFIIWPIVCGIPMMLYYTKIQKFGMLTITGIIGGIFFYLIGYGWIGLLGWVLGGILSDVVLKIGGYQKFKADLAAGTLGEVYIFCGEESYLREYYLKEVQKKLVPAGFEEFNFHRVAGKGLTMEELTEMTEAMPMMAERTLIVVTDCDLYKLGEEQRTRLLALLDDFPEYCCLIFIYDLVEYKPNKTYKKLYAALSDKAQEVRFEPQDKSDLINWIARRFRATGHDIDARTAEHLMFTCGSLMTGLVPEIEKIGAYAKGRAVTVEDINAVADPVLDAVVFDMTSAVTKGDYDRASELLGQLLKKQEEPIMILGVISKELRRLYTARLALDSGKDKLWLMDLWNMRSDYPARLLLDAARKTTHEWCANSLALCQKLDRRMKSEKGIDREGELKLLLMQLAQRA